MSYTDNPENWKYTQTIRDKRNEYTSLYTAFSILYPWLNDHQLRVVVAKEYRGQNN